MGTLLRIYAVCFVVNTWGLYKDYMKFRRFFEKPENQMWINLYNSISEKYKSKWTMIKTVLIVWFTVFYFYVAPLYTLITVIVSVFKIFRFFNKNRINQEPETVPVEDVEDVEELSYLSIPQNIEHEI